jgi:hypothetical protein
MTHLENYRVMLSQSKLPLHESNNKLRDFDEIFSENGHLFSFNREILGTFDLCGPCEAHALLVGVEKGLAKSILNSTTLAQLDPILRDGNINFKKCPSF